MLRRGWSEAIMMVVRSVRTPILRIASNCASSPVVRGPKGVSCSSPSMNTVAHL